ncbi:MAG: hypothetical protein QOG12_1954, partial [Verrucomicrobiota bacterium]
MIRRFYPGSIVATFALAIAVYEF